MLVFSRQSFKLLMVAASFFKAKRFFFHPLLLANNGSSDFFDVISQDKMCLPRTIMLNCEILLLLETDSVV